MSAAQKSAGAPGRQAAARPLLSNCVPEVVSLYTAAMEDADLIGAYVRRAARRLEKARGYAKRCTEPWLDYALADLRDAETEAAELEREFDTACNRAGYLAEEIADEYDLPIEVAIAAAVEGGQTPRGGGSLMAASHAARAFLAGRSFPDADTAADAGAQAPAAPATTTPIFADVSAQDVVDAIFGPRGSARADNPTPAIFADVTADDVCAAIWGARP